MDGNAGARGARTAADADGCYRRECPGEAAIAAAATDRLHDQAGRIRAMRGDGLRPAIGRAEEDLAAVAPLAARAADTHGGAEAAGNDEAAVAAAAAQRLRDDAGRPRLE
ncbi:hypothetical protein EOD04_38120, partial [Mesorhizobium sp. M2C.T.Ca.TU.009.01.2.1]